MDEEDLAYAGITRPITIGIPNRRGQSLSSSGKFWLMAWATRQMEPEPIAPLGEDWGERSDSLFREQNTQVIGEWYPLSLFPFCEHLYLETYIGPFPSSCIRATQQMVGLMVSLLKG